MLIRSVIFGALRPALLIFLNVPLALSGGVLSLWLRGLPLSISAAVGILFGYYPARQAARVTPMTSLRYE